MKVVIIFGTLLLLNISLAQGRNVQAGAAYPDGPQGPDFANNPGAMLVDLLEGGIEAHWNIEEHPPRYVNDELQEYTRDAVTQDSSTNVITITAQKVSSDHITSGRINSNGKWNSGNSESTKRRGYLEVRAKFPAKSNGDSFRGAWPAVWMLGTGNGGHWPGEGEIDIMESVNGDPEVVMSLHSTHHNGGNAQHPPADPLFANADFSRDGAILGLEWNVQDNIGQLDITWWISYFDLGTNSWTSMHSTKSLFSSAGAGNDYDDFYNSFVNAPGFYAIINLAEGGQFPQCFDYSCTFVDGQPQYVIVDSAKVYQYSG